MASYEQVLLYCKYTTLWLLWDDVVVETIQDERIVQPPTLALRGDKVENSASDPWVEGFKHIGDEVERYLSSY
jgi:hypothetical protein